MVPVTNIRYDKGALPKFCSSSVLLSSCLFKKCKNRARTSAKCTLRSIHYSDLNLNYSDADLSQPVKTYHSPFQVKQSKLCHWLIDCAQTQHSIYHHENFSNIKQIQLCDELLNDSVKLGCNQTIGGNGIFSFKFADENCLKLMLPEPWQTRYWCFNLTLPQQETVSHNLTRITRYIGVQNTEIEKA